MRRQSFPTSFRKQRGFATVAAVVGAGAAVYSAYSSDQNARNNNDRANQSASDSSATSAAQLKIAQQQFDLAKEQWDNYKTTFQPLAESIVKKSQEGVAPDYDTVERQAVADVQQQADKGWNDYVRQVSDRTGIAFNPDSGAYQSALQKWRMGQAQSEALARQQAHTSEKYRTEDIGWSRPLQAFSLGQGLPAQVSALNSSAGALTGQAAGNYGALAGTQSALAQQQYQNAAQGYYGAGRALGGAKWFNNNSGETPYAGQANYTGQTSYIEQGQGGDPYAFANMRDGGHVGAIRMRYKNGGAIRMAQGGHIEGPGTGTSDSIRTDLPDDAYVIPADVVKHKGIEFFDKMHGPGKRKFQGALGGQEADVSNGEYVIDPDVVRSKGVEFFDKLLERYHTPTHPNYADGGKTRVALPRAIEEAIRGMSSGSAMRRH
jgi:hypothetical protein